MIEKIVNGKMEKFYEENCLYEQHFIKDESVTVGEMVSQMIAQAGREHFHPPLRALQGRRSAGISPPSPPQSRSRVLSGILFRRRSRGVSICRIAALG